MQISRLYAEDRKQAEIIAENHRNAYGYKIIRDSGDCIEMRKPCGRILYDYLQIEIR